MRFILNNETDRVFQKFNLLNISSIISIIFAMNCLIDDCEEVEFKKLYHTDTEDIYCQNHFNCKNIILTDFTLRKSQIGITE